MGQRLAPVLAICFMSRVERPVIARMPIMYCRYIDDCCVITSTQQEMDELFDILNRQSQYIKFTREVPHEGWLPYLNNADKHLKWKVQCEMVSEEQLEEHLTPLNVCSPRSCKTCSSS
uniref:Reverse transcriptase domain-containing protein n=1 Tax=Haemonchus contortus TaxID=6289 RepID=A0A7I4Z2Y6_HAECO